MYKNVSLQLNELTNKFNQLKEYYEKNKEKLEKIRKECVENLKKQQKTEI